MYALILATCLGLSCAQHKIISVHVDLSACEAEMEVMYELIRPGQALMCVSQAEKT
jgi:hypothetical protein